MQNSYRAKYRTSRRFWFTADHPVSEETLEVEAVYHPAYTGARDCYGAPLTPDQDEYVNICEVLNSDGNPIAYADIESTLEEMALSEIRKTQ